MKHQKVTKKCFQQRGFFAARAFALQNGQNHGLGKFAPCCAAHAPRFSKNSLCPSRAQPTTFCPLSPEASLLTKQEKSFNPLIKQIKVQTVNEICVINKINGSEAALGIAAGTGRRG